MGVVIGFCYYDELVISNGAVSTSLNTVRRTEVPKTKLDQRVLAQINHLRQVPTYYQRPSQLKQYRTDTSGISRNVHQLELSGWQEKRTDGRMELFQSLS